MSFCDVASQSFRATLRTALLRNYARGQELCTVTSLRTVAGCKQGHAPCRKQPILSFVIDEHHIDSKTLRSRIFQHFSGL